MPLHAILAAILVSLCWGGNFSASKFAMMDFPPFLTTLLRFSIVTLILAPLALRMRPWPRMRDMLIISLTLIVLHFAMIFVAMSMGLNVTSVIVATQMGVPFSCIVSSVLFKDHLGPWRAAGLMVAFIGVLIVALSPNASDHWGAFMLAVIGALAWSSSNIYMKIMQPVKVIPQLFWPALFSLPVLLALGLLFEHDPLGHLANARATSWMGIAYSVCISSFIGYGLWHWLITKYPLSQVVPFSLCVPIAGISGGVLLFGDPLTPQILLGAALTIVGVGIIALRRPALARDAEAQ